MKRFACLILGLMLCSLGLGCARQVTSKTESLMMDVTLTFRGPVDLTRFRYFLVFAPSSSPVLPNAASQSYFPTPGSSLNLSNSELTSHPNGLTFYYQSYFSTWSDYLLITSDLSGQPTAKLFSSGGVGFSATTSQNTTYQASNSFQPVTLSASGSQIHVLFPLSYFPILTSQVYFNFATSELLDATQSGVLREALNSESPVLQLSSGSKIDLRTEASNPDISDGADLIGWEAQIR